MTTERAISYDIIVIGLGPAGMSVALMAAELGLKVVAIEEKSLGGECMNEGCIPSKALLKAAKSLKQAQNLNPFGINAQLNIENITPFSQIQDNLSHIREKKIGKLFNKVDVKYSKASFIDEYHVQAGQDIFTAKKIFICTGTTPNIPKIDGLSSVNYLTNRSIFHLKKIPESLLIIGGGATGCELSQAFARLGSQVILINQNEQILPFADEEAALLIEKSLQKEGIEIFNDHTIQLIESQGDLIRVTLESGQVFVVEKLFLATGRNLNIGSLNLDKANIIVAQDRIPVDSYLRTNKKHIFAIGDCNRSAMFSHAAMHQGMIALLNNFLPPLFKKNYRKYPVPWSVFTDPTLSQVGMNLEELTRRKKNFFTHKIEYSDYGATYAENLRTGFVKVYTNKWGKIYGAIVVGENSQELIQEWALAIQNGLYMHHIVFQQHSFPSISYINKQLAEKWMMQFMSERPWISRLAKLLW